MTVPATRLLVSILTTASIGFGILTLNQSSAQATSPILNSLIDVQNVFDSVATFTNELNATVDRMIGYNDSVNLTGLIPSLNVAPVAGYLNEASPMYAVLSGDYSSSFTSFQTLSLLSLGMYEEGTARLSMYSQSVERIQRGLMIQSLPLSVPVEGTITSGFGLRNHPILRGRRMHKGLDIAAPRGTSIYTTGAGTVTFSGRKRGYGNVIIVDHGFGYQTLYAHCSKLMVEEGAKVSRGDLIALVGSTGRSTGPHLHYEVIMNDANLNPEVFLVYSRDQVETLESIAKEYLTM